MWTVATNNYSRRLFGSLGMEELKVQRWEDYELDNGEKPFKNKVASDAAVGMFKKL